MARGINKVILIGNLGNDPEVRYMPNGGAVANITVATSEQWKDKQTGEQQERTEWHRVALYRRLAEVAGEYLRKGSRVYIEGKLQIKTATTAIPPKLSPTTCRCWTVAALLAAPDRASSRRPRINPVPRRLAAVWMTSTTTSPSSGGLISG